ncbi:MAG: cation:proton antiporter [Salinivirgaceae bacterium]|jgi:NhaP-type Na+/H+ or K+/H+ antiporter|nr:cation:proton antiporter [Salinivirgaceae bacterium]
MNGINAYALIIASSVIIIVSYFYGIIAKKTNIPSVLLLIVTGILIHQGLLLSGVPKINLFPILEVFGIIGLIMIVLEAALDLKLSKEKMPLIINSFFISVISLFGGSFGIAAIFMELLEIDLITALIYAIPLSIMSSAIVIPSVSNLSNEKKEFMIYESTLSDILGIMFFYLLIQSADATTTSQVAVSVILNISLTLIVSIVASYGLIYVFHKLENSIRLFLLIAVLILLYAIGKLFHLSSLLIILAFGLVLNNRKLFLRGKYKKYMNDSALDRVYDQLKLVTVESSFIVRTFFFVIFGMTIVLQSLTNIKVILISILVLMFLYGIRWIILKLFLRRNFMLEWFTAPRGLITVLLFFNIPDEFQVAEFDSGILLFTIIISSVIMAIGMIKFSNNKNEEDTFAEHKTSDNENKNSPLVV